MIRVNWLKILYTQINKYITLYIVTCTTTANFSCSEPSRIELLVVPMYKVPSVDDVIRGTIALTVPQSSGICRNRKPDCILREDIGSKH